MTCLCHCGYDQSEREGDLRDGGGIVGNIVDAGGMDEKCGAAAGHEDQKEGAQKFGGQHAP